MTVAITGSDGFVGKYLLNSLKNREHLNIIPIDLTQGINACNWDEIKDIKADVYIHLANKSFVPDSYSNPYSFYDVNLKSTLNMLELCRINGAKLIYLSSYVYGAPEYLPIDENHPIKAFNPYAQTKVMCESMCEGFARDFSVPIIVFRPFNIYGVGQSENFLLPMMIKQMKTGKIQVKDDRPKRDYVHVRDVVQAIECAIDYTPQQVKLCEIINIGSGTSYSVKEIVDILISLSNTQIDYSATGETRPSEIMDTIANVDKLKQIGWQQKVSLKEGLAEMIAYYQK